MALKRLCSYFCCNELIDYSEKYCEKHKVMAEQERKQRYKDYKASRTDKKEQAFYKSKEWEQVRELAKSRTNYIDIYEYYTTGKIISGDVVHHITEVKEDWNKRLDIENLIYLRSRNHSIIHAAYNKSYKDKVEMQRLLIELIDRFKKEFY